MTIAIIDDHKLLGQTLKLLLENNLDKTDIRVYSEANVFLKEPFTDWKPDLVIVDFFMPGMNAIEMITVVQPRLPEAKFIILTSLSDTAMIREAFRIGISGYVTKDAADIELLEAIETVMKGGKYINLSMKDKLVNNIFSDQNEEYRLSPREEEVLKKYVREIRQKKLLIKWA
ncbi:response regulator transcription factor [Dyadobacter sp. NIV53]|uniref:response regulator transcription factor n=1 Tax=Dyadobacter sp. NIV53 TaxID=2861765 RepID=UPI001C88D7B1|nr:response regulator transcription factor [Dyadobacter sp. NIV53]